MRFWRARLSSMCRCRIRHLHCVFALWFPHNSLSSPGDFLNHEMTLHFVEVGRPLAIP